MTKIQFALVGITLFFLNAANAWAEQPKLSKAPPPRIFTVFTIDKEGLEIRETTPTDDGLLMESTYRPAFRDIDIFTARGKKLTAQEFAQRVKPGMVVLVAADEHPVDPAYLATLKPETIVLQGVVVRVEGEPIKPQVVGQ